ncbi:metallophosphoesterase [Propionibacterium freudenreichii]|nr:Ser/Thr protein phosphatase family protein [Propionibacterium freudenreichii subsp. freudenreichii]MCT2972810.1 metallophosphoesterase [Propionibacterium freudenreichii]CEG90336.1 Metallophosphoesterase [Propionibacterium freudenreichii]SBN42761.1 Putative metallophosphoesterase ykuE [Propionibacterium freudenreichii]
MTQKPSPTGSAVTHHTSALKSLMGAGLGFGASMLAGGLVEAHAFLIRRHRIPILAPGSAPIRVLHISDLHLLARQDDALRFLAGLAALEPDLVVSTGDHVSEASAIAPMMAALGPLLRLPGVFVFGSNDFVKPHFRNPLGYLWRGATGRHQRHHADDPALALPTGELRDQLASHGWTYLDDVDTTLSVAGRRVQLRGTGDAHVGRDHYDAVAGPLDTGADVSLGVTHAPYQRVLNAMVDDGFPLILAGHTHGGQVCLPTGQPIVTNCDIDPGHAKGLSRWEHDGAAAWMYVSAGMGTSPYAPYRLFCRPEAALLTLVASDTRE